MAFVEKHACCFCLLPFNKNKLNNFHSCLVWGMATILPATVYHLPLPLARQSQQTDTHTHAHGFTFGAQRGAVWWVRAESGECLVKEKGNKSACGAQGVGWGWTGQGAGAPQQIHWETGRKAKKQKKKRRRWHRPVKSCAEKERG